MEESKFKVSVVAPVLNNKKRITKFLEALLNQNYNKDLYEIIIIDNGSSDGTIDIIKKFDVILLFEHEKLGSPYSARNRGIEKASGDIIALLDSDCIPKGDWLSKAIACFHNKEADIIGGKVIFHYDGEKTAAKIFDANNNIQMKESILERQIAKTANLFVRREVFNHIGLFPEGIRSGGDVRWTKHASFSGFKIVFCEKACVWKPARGIKGLIKKHWRVALVHPTIWLEEGGGNYDFLLLLIIFLKRLTFFSLIKPHKKVQSFKKMLKNKDIKKYRIRILLIGFFIYIIMNLANFVAILKMVFTSIRNKS